MCSKSKRSCLFCSYVGLIFPSSLFSSCLRVIRKVLLETQSFTYSIYFQGIKMWLTGFNLTYYVDHLPLTQQYAHPPTSCLRIHSLEEDTEIRHIIILLQVVVVAISKINQGKECIILTREQTKLFWGQYLSWWLTEGSKVTSVNTWMKSFRGREKRSTKT